MAGMSGGARVALGVALASKDIAGVIASSAGYPDDRVRKALPFPCLPRQALRFQSSRNAKVGSRVHPHRTISRSSTGDMCGCRAISQWKPSSGWTCRR